MLSVVTSALVFSGGCARFRAQERNDAGAIEVRLTALDCVGFDLPGDGDSEVNSVVSIDPPLLTISVLDEELGEDRHFTLPYEAAECAVNPSLRPHVEQARAQAIAGVDAADWQKASAIEAIPVPEQAVLAGRGNVCGVDPGAPLCVEQVWHLPAGTTEAQLRIFYDEVLPRESRWHEWDPCFRGRGGIEADGVVMRSYQRGERSSLVLHADAPAGGPAYVSIRRDVGEMPRQ